MTEESVRFDEGHELGRFVIRQRVGKGRHGDVYRAYDNLLQREIALKVFGNRQLDDQWIEEARIISKIRHPSIVPNLECGVVGKLRFIAQEYVDGDSLTVQVARIREELSTTSRSALRQSLKWVMQVGEAIQHLHDQDIIHGDIKPDNILVDDHNRARLIDFGSSAEVAQAQQEMSTRAAVGTPAYVAPELIEAESDIDLKKCDQYGLGVVLFEVLTGMTPFFGRPEQVLYEAVHADTPSPREADASISRDLEAVCLRALSKDPAARYEDVSELCADIKRIIRGEETIARPLTRTTKLSRWSRRNPVLAASMVLVGIGLIAIQVEASRFAILRSRLSSELNRHHEQSQQHASDLADSNLALETKREQLQRLIDDTLQLQEDYEAANTELAIERAHLNEESQSIQIATNDLQRTLNERDDTKRELESVIEEIDREAQFRDGIALSESVIRELIQRDPESLPTGPADPYRFQLFAARIYLDNDMPAQAAETLRHCLVGNRGPEWQFLMQQTVEDEREDAWAEVGATGNRNSLFDPHGRYIITTGQPQASGGVSPYHNAYDVDQKRWTSMNLYLPTPLAANLLSVAWAMGEQEIGVRFQNSITKQVRVRFADGVEYVGPTRMDEVCRLAMRLSDDSWCLVTGPDDIGFFQITRDQGELSLWRMLSDGTTDRMLFDRLVSDVDSSWDGSSFFFLRKSGGRVGSEQEIVLTEIDNEGSPTGHFRTTVPSGNVVQMSTLRRLDRQGNFFAAGSFLAELDRNDHSLSIRPIPRTLRSSTSTGMRQGFVEPSGQRFVSWSGNRIQFYHMLSGELQLEWPLPDFEARSGMMVKDDIQRIVQCGQSGERFFVVSRSGNIFLMTL